MSFVDIKIYKFKKKIPFFESKTQKTTNTQSYTSYV